MRIQKLQNNSLKFNLLNSSLKNDFSKLWFIKWPVSLKTFSVKTIQAAMQKYLDKKFWKISFR